MTICGFDDGALVTLLRLLGLRGLFVRTGLPEQTKAGAIFGHDDGFYVPVFVEEHLVDGQDSLADACAVERVAMVNDVPVVRVRNMQD